MLWLWIKYMLIFVIVLLKFFFKKFKYFFYVDFIYVLFIKYFLKINI